MKILYRPSSGQEIFELETDPRHASKRSATWSGATVQGRKKPQSFEKHFLKLRNFKFSKPYMIEIACGDMVFTPPPGLGIAIRLRTALLSLIGRTITNPGQRPIDHRRRMFTLGAGPIRLAIITPSGNVLTIGISIFGETDRFPLCGHVAGSPVNRFEIPELGRPKARCRPHAEEIVSLHHPDKYIN